MENCQAGLYLYCHTNSQLHNAENLYDWNEGFLYGFEKDEDLVLYLENWKKEMKENVDSLRKAAHKYREHAEYGETYTKILADLPTLQMRRHAADRIVDLFIADEIYPANNRVGYKHKGE